MSTVLWIAGIWPVHLSGLRSPDQATSKIFSKLWPLFCQPLMIWMRSRLPEVGSFAAHTRNVGAFDVEGMGCRSPPMGTPFAYAAFTQSLASSRPDAYPQPPKKRTLMSGPLTPKVSLRYMASQIEARVFSSAHVPVSPPGLSHRTSAPVKLCPAIRVWMVPSTAACPP